MKNIKKLLIAATLLLCMVGGAGQASADTGSTPTSFGVTWEGAGLYISAGVTWE